VDAGESYKAPTKAIAASPPFAKDPGQMLGEKRKDVAAATRQPRARPAL